MDHTLDSCLNFASYFLQTCGSLVTPTTVTGTTMEGLLNSGKASTVSCTKMIRNDCDAYGNTRFAAPVYDQAYTAYQNSIKQVNYDSFGGHVDPMDSNNNQIYAGTNPCGCSQDQNAAGYEEFCPNNTKDPMFVCEVPTYPSAPA